MNAGFPEGSGILRFVAAVRGSTRRTHFSVALLVAGAFALALALVPSAAELGSHLLNDQDGGRARAWLEQALAEAGPRREIALPLVKVYRDQGEPGRALALLDLIDRLSPASAIPSHVQLAQALRYEALRDAGHGFEAVDALWTQGLESLSAERLQELQQLLAARRLHELQLEVLTEQTRRAPGDMALRAALAHALVGAGRMDAARATLEEIWWRAPTSLRPADAELLLRLRARLDSTDSALRLAEALLALQPSLGQRLDHAQRLLQEARPEMALALLQPLLGSASGDEEVLLAALQALLQLGRVDDALAEVQAHLARVDEAAAAPPEIAREGEAATGPGPARPSLSGRVATLVLRAALQGGRDELALSLAADVDPRGVERDVLLWLAEVAAGRDGGGALCRKLVVAIDARPERGRAATVARLAWQAGASDVAARWLARARAAGSADGVSHRDLTSLALLLRDRAAAREQLDAWAESLDPEREPWLDLAATYVRVGATAQGERAIAGLCQRARRSASARCRASTALLWAAAGRLDEASSALDAGLPAALRLELRGVLAHAGPEVPTPDAQVRDWLRALASLAVEAGHAELIRRSYAALAIAAPGDRAVQLALARAHLDSGDHEAALRVLRRLQPPDDESGALMRIALLGAWRRHRTHRDELVRAAVAYIARADLRTADTQSWVHLLLELGAEAEAQPSLTKLAAWYGGGWADRRLSALKAAGDLGAVRSALLDRAQDSAQPLAVRLAAIESLREGGEREAAMRLLLELAAGEPAESPAVVRLLALAGPRPPTAVRALLVKRAEAAEGDQRRAFARHLLWIHAERDALRLLERDPHPESIALVVQSLVGLRDGAALAALARTHLPTLSDAALVERLARGLHDLAERPAAQLAFERLLALRPQHEEALRHLARAQARRPALAERYWQALMALPPTARGPIGFRDHLALAEALTAQPGRATEAQTHLQVALRLLDAEPDAPGFDRDRLAGMLLARLRRPLEAAARLRTALERAPCDDGLRADLVAALMAAQRLEDADAVVEPPARCRQGAAVGTTP